MTVAELIAKLREEAEPVGPMHAHWDLIFDLEALLQGKPTLLPAPELRAMATRYVEEIPDADGLGVSWRT